MTDERARIVLGRCLHAAEARAEDELADTADESGIRRVNRHLEELNLARLWLRSAVCPAKPLRKARV